MPMATSSTLAAGSSSASTLSGGGSAGAVGGSAPLISAGAAQFREIHKNTWLKRLTAEGKKITVGPKKSDRSWVVFCVHDDTDALLEGYAEPRQAPSHQPEWTVSMQDTLHISHALIPNSHEFEFVVTLANEVIRFHAMSWEIMQEWVETLRSKLREMKILSPRENLYTKLPEIRAPLLPTRDPTSPLPAPPPVPAAIVPGVERVVPSSLVVQDNATTQETRHEGNNSTSSTTTTTITHSVTTTTYSASSFSNSGIDRSNASNSAANASTNSGSTPVPTVSVSNTQTMALPALTSMSNTLTQNLLNMLSDPIIAYSEQINDVSHLEDSASSIGDANDLYFDDEFLSPILRKSQRKLENPTSTTNADNSVRVDIGQRASADQIKNWERFVEDECNTPTRLHTSRSLSAGAADSTRKQMTKSAITNNIPANTTNNDNITAFEISTDTPQCQPWQNAAITSTTSSDTIEEQLDIDKMNITIIQVSTNDTSEQENETNENTKSTPSSSSSSTKRVMGDIFKFPETTPQLEYKSNVQIIPSTKTNSNTIQVIGNKTNKTTTITKTQYAAPVKKNMKNVVATTTPATKTHHPSDEDLKITTVHVTGNTTTTAAAATLGTNSSTTTDVNAVTSASAVSLYGTCYTTPTPSIPQSTSSTQTANMSLFNGGGTPKMSKKIILSANSSGITNITVNNASTTNATSDTTVKHNVGSVHYEQVFLSSSAPPSNFGTSISTGMTAMPPISPTLIGNSPIPKRTTEASATTGNKSRSTSKPSSPIPTAEGQKQDKPTVAARTVSPSTTINVSGADTPSLPVKSKHKAKQSPLMARAHPSANSSPVPDRRRLPTATNLHVQATTTTTTATTSSPLQQTKSTSSSTTTTAATTSSTPFHLPSRAHLLKRGLTEAVITTRPSRRDFHLMKAEKTGKGKTSASSSSKNSTTTKTTVTLNNNTGDNAPTTQQILNTPNASCSSHAALNSSRNRNCELLEQRRRSSSTSDARTGGGGGGGGARGTNNNELPSGRNAALRFQQPPQPFRNAAENGVLNGGVNGSATAPTPPPSSGANNSPANMRMTLREHQVMQLRREIMHPGGVRLQLRRKDCVGSIAWVDAFGAVWVAGWKQKEHPVLYNALHIGDQLLSIAGTAVSTANEANKIIRNSNTLFVEVLVRRIPFGRGYAIRREREGQCLGLIRDGNTATIVDVVPNSLAARHGLPPKAQSCDGTTLTFWVLTEINGRPLNLYFKDNEIRDRLNSVGRDISILVQPSDLITKLKKQLKSLRGYKDYLVQ